MERCGLRGGGEECILPVLTGRGRMGRIRDVAVYATATIGALCGIVFVADRLGGEGLAIEPAAGAGAVRCG